MSSDSSDDEQFFDASEELDIGHLQPADSVQLLTKLAESSERHVLAASPTTSPSPRRNSSARASRQSSSTSTASARTPKLPTALEASQTSLSAPDQSEPHLAPATATEAPQAKLPHPTASADAASALPSHAQPSFSDSDAAPVRPPRRKKEQQKELRNSALLADSNSPSHTRTNSEGQQHDFAHLTGLSDEEILKHVSFKNLDTGESLTLDAAGGKAGIDPLSLHIMRRTSEQTDGKKLDSSDQEEELAHTSQSSLPSLAASSSLSTSATNLASPVSAPQSPSSAPAASDNLKAKSKTKQSFISKRFSKMMASEPTPPPLSSGAASATALSSHPGTPGAPATSPSLSSPATAPKSAHVRSPSHDVEEDADFVKVSTSKKSGSEFGHLHCVQDLSGEHVGAVWTMKFSFCGRLLATAGQDAIVRVWAVRGSSTFLSEMKRKFARMDSPGASGGPSSSSSSNNNNNNNSSSSSSSAGGSHNGNNAAFAGHQQHLSPNTPSGPNSLLMPPAPVPKSSGDPNPDPESEHAGIAEPIFESKPICLYKGHSADVLDLSWSKNYFLLSSSMDKTVRLWHVVRQECLCCFQHADFVTAIAFHPRDDRYFLSGSLDSTLRLWNIPEKKVALWNEIVGPGNNLITAANFCRNGKMAVVGTYDGRCLFYDSERLKYHTQIHVRSTRGKNSKGRKITGIESMPGEDKILVTSNDSRIRLYDLKDHSLSCKYKGASNASSQIKASFSNDGKYIICGSENQNVYLWNTFADDVGTKKGKLTEKLIGFRRDRNESFELFSAHSAVVTVAIFAPYSTAGLKGIEDTAEGEVLLSADFSGSIKVFVNKSRHPQ